MTTDAAGADAPAPTVRHQPEARRFELVLEGRVVGMADYRATTDPAVQAVFHTEVTPALGGRGLGSVLVAGTLAAFRELGWQVLPQCWFVAAYLRDHPDDLDLVPEGARGAVSG